MPDTIKTFTVSVDVTKLDAAMRRATTDQKNFIGDLLLKSMATPAKQASIMGAESGVAASKWGITITNVV